MGQGVDKNKIESIIGATEATWRENLVNLVQLQKKMPGPASDFYKHTSSRFDICLLTLDSAPSPVPTRVSAFCF